MQRSRREQRSRLRDMSEPLVPDEYIPPKGGEEITYPVSLDEHHSLTVRQLHYRKMVVDFAIMQHYHLYDEHPPEDVHRTDCCHGEVHHHQFFRNGTTEDRRVVLRIPVENGWETVDRLFVECNDLAVNEYMDRLARWKGTQC